MNIRHSICRLAVAMVVAGHVLTGQGNCQDSDIYPKDSLVKKNLEKWQDLKFGIILHWGLYAQAGVVESWGLCSEDQSFQDRNGMNYTDYKDMYFGLIKKFNPVHFDPDRWAEIARKTGMKYLVFTTKHHDGFCMFDTKQTDFRITGPDCPFHSDPRANAAKNVFDAFRKKDFMIGAYYSKPDWHHPAYWSPLLATPDRNNNYDTRKYPERWKEFQDFTFNQVRELTQDYGKIDILWLDGGWVRPDSTLNDEVRSWGYTIPKWEQDPGLPRIAAMARQNQPGLLIVDRTVHGPYEDYRTPEQSVPDKILPYPWESCITLTQNWGHVFHPEYKTAENIIRTLVDVVSKGGNLLLGVGPTPDGTFEDVAIARLGEIGRWMDANGEAIYATRTWNQFGEGDRLRFTRSKDGKYLYVFALELSGKVLEINSLKSWAGKDAVLLASGQKVRIKSVNGSCALQLPESLQKAGPRPVPYVPVFRIAL